jgi:hypothetical protein
MKGRSQPRRRPKIGDSIGVSTRVYRFIVNNDLGSFNKPVLLFVGGISKQPLDRGNRC